MARVTVEDCLDRVPNRFALTVLAARRARQLSEGRGSPLVHCSNKSAVTALREVADGLVRYDEDIDLALRTFIEAQRNEVEQIALLERGYMDTVSLGGEYDGEGEEFDEEIEELTSDLTRLGTKNAQDTDDDVNPATNVENVGTDDDAEDEAPVDAEEDDDASTDDAEDIDVDIDVDIEEGEIDIGAVDDTETAEVEEETDE